MLLFVESLEDVLGDNSLFFVSSTESVRFCCQIGNEHSRQVDQEVLRLRCHLNVFWKLLLNHLTDRSYEDYKKFNLLLGRLTSYSSYSASLSVISMSSFDEFAASASCLVEFAFVVAAGVFDTCLSVVGFCFWFIDLKSVWCACFKLVERGPIFSEIREGQSRSYDDMLTLELP